MIGNHDLRSNLKNQVNTLSIISRMKHKVVDWLVAMPTVLSISLGLFINLGLLLYVSSSWSGSYVIPFLILIVVYINLTILYLQANVKQIRALETERSHTAKVLEIERAHAAQTLEAERTRAIQALETERARTIQALETERARATQALETETKNRALP